jgi:hypothetical protein
MDYSMRERRAPTTSARISNAKLLKGLQSEHGIDLVFGIVIGQRVHELFEVVHDEL